jgi:hypothetical protein
VGNRSNPFYRYNNPALGMGFNGLAAAMFPGQADPRMQSGAIENLAQARQADTAAGMNLERTRGYRDVNDAMMADPTSIAELLLGGGVLNDDPLQMNPDYQPYRPVDFTEIFTNSGIFPDQFEQPVSSMMLPGRTAQEKMAMAVREAAIRKIPLDQLLKAAGINEYQRRAFGDDPDMALPALPFVTGKGPGLNTALTPSRQNRMREQDAGWAQDKQDSINTTNVTREGMSQTGQNTRNAATNRTNVTREGMQQRGANERNRYSTDNRPVNVGTNADVVVPPAQGKILGIQPDADGRYVIRGDTRVGTGQVVVPGSLGGETITGPERQVPGGRAPGARGPTSVPNTATKRMEAKIREALKTSGIKTDEESIRGLVAAAGNSWQESKNPDGAADDVIMRLRNGESVNDVTIDTKKGFLSNSRRTNRQAPAADSSAPRRLNWTNDQKADREMVNALPPGTRFIGPDGVEREKK